MEPKEDHWILRLVLVILVPIVFYLTAITHRFGPYQGTIIDEETGEPIEGAVVLVAFHTKRYGSLAGPQSRFVDAVEAITNNKGEFTIDTQWCWVLRFPQRWEPDGMVTVFKPGYISYWRLLSHPAFVPTYSMPENENVVAGLRKPKTSQERILSTFPDICGDVPAEKMKNLLRLRDLADRGPRRQPYPTTRR